MIMIIVMIMMMLMIMITHTHLFNGPLSRTTRVSGFYCSKRH